MSQPSADIRFRAWSGYAAGERHRSLWIDEAFAEDAADPAARLEGSQRCDVGIVGGGLSGLWTAIRLKQADPSLSVAIVEADLIGTGASGRNSGALGHYWSRLPALVGYFGAEDARRLVLASVEAISNTERFLNDNRLDVQWRRGPSVWSSNVPGQEGRWGGVMRMADKLGIEAPYKPLTSEDLKQMFGRGPYYSGVLDPDAVRLQPAKLCRALRKAALDRGVVVHENSPVTRVASHAADVRIETEHGSLGCGKVLLAANAWMAHLDEFKRTIMVLSSDMVVTPPIPDVLERLGMRDRPGGVNSRQMLNYGGLTPDGRVYLGRGAGTQAYGARVTSAFDYAPDQAREVEEDFRFLYPELAEVPIERAWAGPIDRSTTGLPRFGAMRDDPRIHYAVGYTGHGLGATEMAGHILTSLLLGRQDEWAELGAIFARASNGVFPPEPLRYVVGRIVRGAVLRKETRERMGRVPSPIDRALSQMAMATLPGRAMR